MKDVLSIAHKGKATDLLQELPKPPVYLTGEGKEHYKKWGGKLIHAKILKDHHLAALEVLAASMGEFEWALREIKNRNNEAMGKGYVQTFKSGARQISAELTVKEKATKSIMQCLKQFGMDPKSEKDLKQEGDRAQTNLFDEFKKAMNS